jgi:thiamine pyrophosphokinase
VSSHHIVREDQEPALLILNAHAISFEKVQELLEWMPTVIVLANQIETVLGWGIKVDIVLTPFTDLEDWKNKLIDQAPIKFLPYKADDDPLTTALHFLTASNATAVNCLLDNKNQMTQIESGAGLDVEVFVDRKLWRWIKSGHFEKWVPANTKLFQLPEELHTRFPEFSDGEYLTKNDGIVSLNSTNSFWIGEELT